MSPLLAVLLVAFAEIAIAVALLVRSHRHGGPQHRLNHPDRRPFRFAHLIRREARR